MRHSRSQALLVPELDLSPDILSEILTHIKTDRIIPSLFTQTSRSPRQLDKKLIYKWYLGSGIFQVYRLEKELEQSIKNYYRDFLTLIPVQPKIRLKASQHIRGLMPHSDAADGGDTASLTVAILTNGETTNWFDAGPEFELSLRSLWSLKPTTSLTLDCGQACLFNNSDVHSVTQCDPNLKRFVLTIGWQNISYDQLLDAWGEMP
jgi:hypothetical protein